MVHEDYEKHFQVLVIVGNRNANIHARRKMRVTDLMQSALKQLQPPVEGSLNRDFLPKCNGLRVRCTDSTLEKARLGDGSILELSLGLPGGVVKDMNEIVCDYELGIAYDDDKARIKTMLTVMAEMSSNLLELVQRQQLIEGNVVEIDQDELERNELEQQIKIGDTLANTLRLQMELEDALEGRTHTGREEVKVLLEIMTPKIEMLSWLSKREQPATPIGQAPMPEPLPIRKGVPVLNLVGQGLNKPERLQELITKLSDGQVSGTLTQLNIR